MYEPLSGDLPPNAYENHGGRTVAVITVCLFLVTVVVCLRFYVRLVIVRKFGADDWVLAASLVVTLVAAIVLAAATKFGLGGHAYLLPLPEFSKVLKFIWVATLGYGGAITLMKATVLLQYRRVFPLPNFQQRCDIFLAFVFLWGIGGTLGTMLICLPIERNWDASAPTTCGKRIYFWEVYAILHIITDMIILILPLPLLKTLPLPRVQKWILTAVFCLGFFTCVISVIRITSLRESITNPDITWTAPETVLWSVSEVSCAIICVCVPTLRPLVNIRLSKPRPHELNEGRESGGSSGILKKQRSYGSGHLESQPSTYSPTNADDERLTGEVSLNGTIQKPSGCYLPDCRAESSFSGAV